MSFQALSFVAWSISGSRHCVHSSCPVCDSFPSPSSLVHTYCSLFDGNLKFFFTILYRSRLLLGLGGGSSRLTHSALRCLWSNLSPL
jgi:hypothetical protein